MKTNNLLTSEFSGYKKHHSMETIMIGMTEGISNGFDKDKCTIMLLLNLSADIWYNRHRKNGRNTGCGNKTLRNSTEMV